MQVIPKYRNIVNHVNIFQLIGDARFPETTMQKNIDRILEFYRIALRGRSSAYCDELAELLEKFYLVSNFYRTCGDHHEFIVNDFSRVRNDEWLTINQFMAFLKMAMRDDTLSEVSHHLIYEVLRDSVWLAHTYYSHYTHSTVNLTEFKQIIHKDFKD